MKYIDYIEKVSKLEYKEENRDLKIAILRSYTCENMEPIMKLELYNDNFNANIRYGTFNQYYQEIVDINSFIYNDDIDIILLLIRPQEMFAKLFESDIKKNLNMYKIEALKKIENMIEIIEQHSNIKYIIMANMEEYENEPEGILEYNSINSIISFLKEFNFGLLKIKEKYNNFYLIDINKIISNLGVINVYNNKMKYLSKDPYKIEFYMEFVIYFKRIIKAIFKPSKKVLLLDLDNTLYNGILGEDDINQITNFEEYPQSHYKSLQIKIKNLKNRGVLLGLVSKNNYSDVEKLLKLNKMPLKLEDFVIIKANWEDKYINIIEISKELNLDINSFVFIDDNPYEIELINKKLPEIETINISLNPVEAEKVLDDIYSFDKLNISEEDTKRTELYKVKSNINFENIQNIDNFLKDLKMEISFKILTIQDKNLLERASQMTLKTNQFNMTTKRYSINEIEKIVQDSQNFIIMIFVRDKFGENGSSGLIILKENNVDTFLLSCRILKRKIEYCMLNIAKDIIKNKLKGKELIAKYVKTNKNEAFQDFYIDAGLEEHEDNIFKIDVDKEIQNLPNYIKVIEEGC